MLEGNRRAELNYKLDENMERGRRFWGSFVGCWSGRDFLLKMKNGGRLFEEI